MRNGHRHIKIYLWIHAYVRGYGHAAGFLAFNNNYVQPDSGQEAIQSLLEGYGYPKEGFLEKLWNYLILQAKDEDNANEMRFLMDCATSVLRAMKA